MGRYGAEGASAKTSTVEIDRKLYHVVCRYAFSFVFWMRKTCVRQVEGTVELILAHRLVRRVDHCIESVDGLENA